MPQTAPTRANAGPIPVHPAASGGGGRDARPASDRRGTTGEAVAYAVQAESPGASTRRAFDSGARDETAEGQAGQTFQPDTAVMAPPDDLARPAPAPRLHERPALTLVALSALCGVLALIVPERLASLSLLAVAATFVLIAGGFLLRQQRGAAVQDDTLTLVADFIARDGVPSLLAEPDGRLLRVNAAARETLNLTVPTTVQAALGAVLADAGGLIHRLQQQAAVEGSAQEDVVTRAGQLRIAVHEPAPGSYVWRMDRIADRAPPRGSADGLRLPMVMLGRTDTILHMNDAARRLVGGRVKGLDQLFETPPAHGLTADLATPSGPTPVLVAEVPAGAGRRALFLLPPAGGADAATGAAAEAAAAAASQPWGGLTDLPVPMLKLAPDGAVLDYNAHAARLIGPELAAGVALSELMEGLGRSISDWLSDALAGRKVQKSEFLRLTRADREAFVQVVLNPVVEAGAPAVLAVLHDATELKSLEAQFVQSQKMQAIGQLAGGVAHDFNNLLTAISGHCDLLLLRHDQGDPDYADLNQINQNTNRAAALVGQLLAFSRKQTLRPETVDLRDTLADLTHLLNRLVGERISLTLQHDPVLKPIRADKRQLEQVLMNLVVNARDAMPEGGDIRIVTECTTLAEPMTRDRVTVPAGDYVTVRVVDSGHGIPADKREKVFEPFYTTKRTGEGTGLGLSTAYGIVKQTGGFIFIDSAPPQGTVFSLYFPAQEGPARAAIPLSQEVTPRPVEQADGVVLLVEDEAPVRAFASRALRLRGYTVLEADSAEAALKTLEDPSLNIDIFVTDVVMPGMDGPTWVRQALKTRPDVRVVFVSGYAEGSFGGDQPEIPNSVFLPKPFSLKELTTTVQEQLQ